MSSTSIPIIGDVTCQSGKGLFSRTPDANQECASSGLAKDSRDFRDVLFRVHEKDQLDVLTVRHVVFFQVILKHDVEGYHVRQFRIDPIFSVGTPRWFMKSSSSTAFFHHFGEQRVEVASVHLVAEHHQRQTSCECF